MTTLLNRGAFNGLLRENIEWLQKQERTLERDHIIMILEHELSCGAMHKHECMMSAETGITAESHHADRHRERHPPNGLPNFQIEIEDAAGKTIRAVAMSADLLKVMIEYTDGTFSCIGSASVDHDLDTYAMYDAAQWEKK